MILVDDFKTLLNIGKQLVTDPAVKQAIADDIAALESKAEAGVADLEQHIADWFQARYPLPAPEHGSSPVPTGADPVLPADGSVPAGTVTSLDGTVTADGGSAS